jgi:hypothetical protein
MVTGTVTSPHEAVKVALNVPADFFDLSVKVTVPPAAAV